MDVRFPTFQPVLLHDIVLHIRHPPLSLLAEHHAWGTFEIEIKAVTESVFPFSSIISFQCHEHANIPSLSLLFSSPHHHLIALKTTGVIKATRTRSTLRVPKAHPNESQHHRVLRAIPVPIAKTSENGPLPSPPPPCPTPGPSTRTKKQPHDATKRTPSYVPL